MGRRCRSVSTRTVDIGHYFELYCNKFCSWDSSNDTKSRDSIAWLAFGYGPRVCIGMRLALMELKLTICHLLKRFRIEKCAQTKVILVYFVEF
jgi:hypothetical protein